MLEELDAFVGRWKTEGEGVEDGSVLAGTDTYEWLAGGHFMVHRVDVQLGGEAIQSIEIIGRDPERRDALEMHSFDSTGQHTVMRATLTDGTWRFDGETMRFAGAFAADGRSIAGMWEARTDDGGWKPWMRVKLTKAAE